MTGIHDFDNLCETAIEIEYEHETLDLVLRRRAGQIAGLTIARMAGQRRNGFGRIRQLSRLGLAEARLLKKLLNSVDLK